jgi:hypothetical protein
MDIETSVYYVHLTWLIAPEDYIMTIHLQVVPRLRMCGAIPPLPRMSLWLIIKTLIRQIPPETINLTFTEKCYSLLLTTRIKSLGNACNFRFRPLFSQGKSPRTYPIDRYRVESRAYLDMVVKRKNSLPLLGIEPLFSSPP